MTEVGVIPKDWEVEPLKSLLKEPPKYGINAAAVPLTGNLPVYIRITDISEDGYYSPEKVVGVNSPFSSSYILNEGDIVLARTGASVGKSYLYRKEDGTLIYAGFLIKVSPNEKQLNPKYLHQYLKTEQYWAWVIVNSMRSGQPGINGNEYGRLLIPLPSIEEQTAIATALSDVDNLIQSLEKLIAKKEAIKTGTMQQLLTGKTRLPEFATRDDGSVKGFKQTELGQIPEDWSVSYLLDNVLFIHGKAHEQFVSELGKFIVVNSKFVSTEGNTRKHCTTNFCPAKKGDVLMVLSDLPNGRALAKCFYTDLNNAYAVNQRVCIFRAINVDSKFLFYLLDRYEYFLKIDDGVSQTHILNNDIAACLIYSPKLIQEQNTIATILSDMDTEIQALQQRLDKTRHIKQGMMQQLLTGKVRLAH